MNNPDYNDPASYNEHMCTISNAQARLAARVDALETEATYHRAPAAPQARLDNLDREVSALSVLIKSLEHKHQHMHTWAVSAAELISSVIAEVTELAGSMAPPAPERDEALLRDLTSLSVHLQQLQRMLEDLGVLSAT